MSRIHRLSATFEQVAAVFNAEAAVGMEIPTDTMEGGSGVVMLERPDRRLLKNLDWGFPRLTREMQLRGEAPGRTGMVADLTNRMWESLVTDPAYRCLIPLTHFANPEGKPGAKTRTWFSVADQPIAAWAGFCRNTREFGPVFAGMTMTANTAVEPTNDRMPVLLDPGEWDTWLHGSIRDVIGFQYRPPIASEKIVVERTDEPWRSMAPLPPQTCQPALL